jgi:hypothetical protein
MGGVLFIDEAYYLYRPENERDYGQEAIEILLQVMENQRDDLVVILAGYKDRMDTFFRSNPGLPRASRTTSISRLHCAEDLLRSRTHARAAEYRFGAGARGAFAEYIARRMTQPHFANARSRAQRPRPRAPAPGEPAVCPRQPRVPEREPARATDRKQSCRSTDAPRCRNFSSRSSDIPQSRGTRLTAADQ